MIIISIRTDIAHEMHEFKRNKGVIDGVISTDSEHNGFKTKTVDIKPHASDSIGMATGRYQTIDMGNIWNYDSATFDKVIDTVVTHLEAMLPAKRSSLLVVGLGNERITSDSIGPKAVKNIVVTRHVRRFNENLYSSIGFGEVAAFSPGVMGETGIESADVVKSIVDLIAPSAVLAIDSLATQHIQRLATTIQITDSGIAPGSGVGNRRSTLNQATIGVPVIGIGVPTVVNTATLVHGILENCIGEDALNMSDKINESILADSAFVTPKDCDVMTDTCARLIGEAINRVAHSDVPHSELREYMR